MTGAVNQEKIERALDACYDAVVAPETWATALHSLARSLDAVGCMFRRLDTGGILELPMSPGLSDYMAEFMRDGWWQTDFRAARAWHLVAAGKSVLVDHDIVGEHERRRMPFLNEFSRTHDLPWWACVGFAVDGHTWFLPLLRDTRRGPFDHNDAARLSRLIPHFRRMVSMAEKFAGSGVQSSFVTLEHVGTPAMLLDRQGIVKLLNPSAEALLGHDLKLVQRRLTATHQASDRNLQGLIAALREPGVSRTASAVGSVRIERSGKRPLLVEAMPIAGLVADVFNSLRAILLFADLEARPVLPDEALRAAFGLTAAEAKLASRLARAESLEDAAAALAIGKETARSQLKAVFAKTDTSRQSELVALLGRLPARPQRDTGAGG
jgi:DNA-binding CsgD family transcriptional regulator